MITVVSKLVLRDIKPHRPVIFLANYNRTSTRLNFSSDSQRNTNNYFRYDDNGSVIKRIGVGVGVFIGAGLLYSLKSEKITKASSAEEDAKKNLPIYTKDEISKHKTKENRIWVSYKDGVYDITDFVGVHPGGGDKIMLAAGGSLEPFWALYAVHKKEEVLDILEELRIGNLDPKDKSADEKKAAVDDPYSNDPSRHPALLPCCEKPYNAETPPSLLTDNFLTPNELFFVRNHLPVPRIDASKYELEVGGEGMKTKKYKLEDLKRKFKPVKITATIQCAGNRRNEMNPIKQVKGLTWTGTAISNAEWTGVRLSDVLKESGIEKNRENLQHVQFEGFDKDITGQKYGASIEIEKATDPSGDVILAYEMNGAPLPVDHGFPLRVVVPGIVGARNVKWLSKIYVSKKESDSHWQQNDYKSFSPSTDWDTVDFKSAPAIQDAPIQSAICTPSPGQKLPKGAKEVEVKGYAWSGGGRGVVRVDVSADGGKTWKTAELNRHENQKLSRMWAWTLWSCTLPLPEIVNNKKVELICKATDISYNSQPDSVAGIWNLRGVLNNAWHRVVINVE